MCRSRICTTATASVSHLDRVRRISREVGSSIDDVRSLALARTVTVLLPPATRAAHVADTSAMSARPVLEPLGTTQPLEVDRGDRLGTAGKDARKARRRTPPPKRGVGGCMIVPCSVKNTTELLSSVSSWDSRDRTRSPPRTAPSPLAGEERDTASPIRHQGSAGPKAKREARVVRASFPFIQLPAEPKPLLSRASTLSYAAIPRRRRAAP